MSARSIDHSSLLARFGLDSFRPGQREVVEAVAAGEDVLCVMPTGGGKSLCFQLPSLARDGTTIVVSPLIALMKDQVDTLKRLGIAARLINSSLSAGEQEDVMRQMAAGELDLVYVAPERLRNGRFLEAVSHAGVSLLAIDEAHCVSEWGHDFRPDYARLGHFRNRYLGGVQTIALTATATPHVRQDIQAILGMKQPREFVTGFARSNLRFSVEHHKSDAAKNEALVKFLKRQTGSGIIYAATRKRCEELADWLPTQARRAIGVYHAGLDSVQRHVVQDRFMSGDLSAIVATNAFGMGIDKANIRYVVHYNVPGSLEAYYQEAGRAGRDGEMSECRLLFAYSDRYIQEFFIENRYPSPELVRKVYEYLLSLAEDPIELTLQQVREAIGAKEAAESVGTAQTLLAKAGVLKRLESSANAAIVRIDSDLPTLVDLLPREAKLRRKVLQAVETIVGKRRGEDVYVRPQKIAELASVDRDQLARTLRELVRLRAFDYVPPFRGRGIHIMQRDLPFDSLEIDFDELQRRKGAEYDKLEAAIEFARTPRCRQRAILDYFGDPHSCDCGKCDRCDPAAKCLPSDERIKSAAATLEASSPASPDYDQQAVLRGVRIVLSGIKRMHARFGKAMVAQMLGGSQNKKIQQWKLNRLSTYGMLSGLKQPELVDLIDAIIESGMASQVEVEERRPTLQLTAFGESVMRATEPLPAGFSLTYPLAKRLARAAATIEGSDVSMETGAVPASGDDFDAVSAIGPTADDLADRLKRWRGRTAAALGLPAYRVLTNATIERLVAVRPRSIDELELVHGIGPATIEQFGYDLVGLVGAATSDEASAQPADALPRPSEKVVDAAVPSTAQGDAYWTWRLLQEGFSWSQVAEIRRIDAAQMMGHLRAASRDGHPIDQRWLPSSSDPEADFAQSRADGDG